MQNFYNAHNISIQTEEPTVKRPNSWKNTNHEFYDALTLKADFNLLSGASRRLPPGQDFSRKKMFIYF